MTTAAPALTALVLNCTLTPSPGDSSTQRLADQVLAALGEHGVTGDSVRLVDLPIAPGVLADMGDGDGWPQVRQRILDADILVFATPTWVGHMSSVAQRAVERLDAELSETDEQGRPLVFGKVGTVVVVGNEDGAHKVCADLFQALDDIGFSLAAQAAVYWNGEAMQGVDYKDLDETPEMVAATTAKLAANAAHLATLLRADPYPPVS
jgi:multimeric flavodoxin WrbA